MKRLYRSHTERLLGGICGGIGQYIYPNLIRILWVVLTLLSISIRGIAYLVAWIIMPKKPEERAESVSVTQELSFGQEVFRTIPDPGDCESGFSRGVCS